MRARASSKLPFWLLATGVIGLGLGTLIAEYRQAQRAVEMSFGETIRRTAAPAVLTCLAGFLVLLVVLLLALASMLHLPDFSDETTFLRQTSPNGWLNPARHCLPLGRPQHSPQDGRKDYQSKVRVQHQRCGV